MGHKGRRTSREHGSGDLALALATSLGGIGMFWWDPRDDALVLSERARSILRVTSEQAATMDQAIATTLHPSEQDRARVERDHSRSLAQPLPVGEWRLADDGGERRWVATTMAPAGRGPRAAEMIGSLMDVTERHEWARERGLYLRAFEALALEDGPAQALAALIDGGRVPADLERAVRAAAARLSGGERPRIPSGGSPLTARETEVLQMASHGGSSAAIAERLVVSTSTVKTHFEHIYAKLGVADRAGAVADGLRRGLIG